MDESFREPESGVAPTVDETGASLEWPAFEPPSGYAFEPELMGSSPRPVPERVHQGPWAQKQWLGIQWLIFSGGLCGVLSTFPQVRAAGVYFLPLLYLSWIAAGLLAIAAVTWLWIRFGNSPLRYIERGIPLVGRVLGLTKQPAAVFNGQPANFNFTALVDFLHPQTGEIMSAEFPSSEFSVDARHKFDTSFRVGDYVTLVYLPGDLESTLRLYGFLDLAPDLGLIKVGKPTTFLQVAAGTVALTTIFGLLIWNVYALERFEPLEYAWHDFWLPIGLGVVLGLGFLAYLVHQHRKEQREQGRRNLEAWHQGKAVEIGQGSPFAQTGLFNRLMQIALVLGAPALGGLIGAVLAFSANGLLDDGPIETRPVKILDLYEESHAYVVRQFYAEYTIEDDPEGLGNERKLYTSPEHLTILAGDGPFEAVIRPGRFGFPWVETIQPVGAPASPDNP